MKTSFPITTLAVLTLAQTQAYDLHEWGTFTTVSGSDGVILTGLEREEEHLPSFVAHHPGFDNNIRQLNAFINPMFMTKLAPVPVRNVKVKMETPVIYFHSDEGFKAEVQVDFKGGTISQWYPLRSDGETFTRTDPKDPKKPNILDFSRSYAGSITWNIDVLSPEEGKDVVRFKPEDLVQWTRARIPEANMLRDHKGNTENFLFYRGLGSFDPGMKTTVSDDETLHLTNNTGGAIPYLLVYEKLPDGTTRWAERHGMNADATLSFSEKDLKGDGKPWSWAGMEPKHDSNLVAPPHTSSGFDEKLYRSLSKNLAAQGLLQSEAEAMVQTWWKSYFDAPGLRIFWVLPDEKTNSILPLRVKPAPENTVRVLVGRSEVIRPHQEKEWLARANSKDEKVVNAWHWFANSDRFGIAYQQRVSSLQRQAKR